MIKKKEIDSLEEELKEKKMVIKHLEEELQHEKLKEQTHIEAFEVSERWNKNQKAELREEVAEKSKEVKTTRERLIKKDEIIDKLQMELEEKIGELKKAREKCKKTEDLLYMTNKPLPSLPKKQNKFKQFGTKIKTKFKHLIEKNKLQKQEMIARIEINTK